MEQFFFFLRRGSTFVISPPHCKHAADGTDLTQKPPTVEFNEKPDDANETVSRPIKATNAYTTRAGLSINARSEPDLGMWGS